MKTLIPVSTEETHMEIRARIAKLSATVFRSAGIKADSADILAGRHFNKKELANGK